jgi:Arc/MetJ family transcription regulator
MTIVANLIIDDKLIEEARKIGGHDTKKAAVTAALLEYIQHRSQLKLLDLFGKIEYDPNYDYKKQRKRS